MAKFNLNFNNANVMTFEQENELFAGQNIKLTFRLAEKEFVHEFKAGQDVEWAKKCVAENLNCARTDFDLVFEDKVMPEFFSLNDIPNLGTGSVITVKMR